MVSTGTFIYVSSTEGAEPDSTRSTRKPGGAKGEDRGGMLRKEKNAQEDKEQEEKEVAKEVYDEEVHVKR